MGLYVKLKILAITNISLLTRHVASKNKNMTGAFTQTTGFTSTQYFQLRNNTTSKTHKNLRTYMSSN